MYVTLRQFPRITPADFDILMSRAAEVEFLIRQVPSFVQYQLMRTTTGITSITPSEDRVGAEVSNVRMAGWIEANLPALFVHRPVITTGDQVAHFSV